MQSKRKPDRFENFYRSWEWKRLRYEVLLAKTPKCECCGSSPTNDAHIVVDHIKPIRRHWALRLDPDNCQVLCNDCNMGKGSWYETDWRPKYAAESLYPDILVTKIVAPTSITPVAIPNLQRQKRKAEQKVRRKDRRKIRIARNKLANSAQPKSASKEDLRAMAQKALEGFEQKRELDKAKIRMRSASKRSV